MSNPSADSTISGLPLAQTLLGSEQFVIDQNQSGTLNTVRLPLAQLATQIFNGGNPNPVAGGGTGRTSLTAHAVLVGEGASPVNQIGPGTTGQLLIGVTGADPAWGTNPALNGATAVTNGRADNSTLVATDAFVNQQIISATANVPFPLVGGTYNQATLGTGLTVVIFVTGADNHISSILSVVSGGTGYAVGDLVLVPSGNSDAVLRITNVVGGVVQSGGVSVIYGGTGYTTSSQVTAVPVPPGQRTVTLTGVLTSNVTFIIQNGTFLTAARRIQWNNNTTGAFTVTVKISDGAGGSTGTGIVLPQGTNNSSAVLVETDGVNDVWLADTLVGLGIASPPAIGNTTPNTGKFTTLQATGAITPSTTAGIVGTTAADNANAGSVGEVLSNQTNSTSLTTSTPANATSVSLTAGDWDVTGAVQFVPAGGTTVSSVFAGIGTVSATLPSFPNLAGFNTTFATGSGEIVNVPTTRINVSTTTTVFMVAQSAFGTSTMTCNGFIRARRVR